MTASGREDTAPSRPVAHVQLHVRGLSSAEAVARLAADGPNALPVPPRVRLWRRVAAQLRDPLVLVLLAAAVLTLATGDFTDASVIILVIVVNTGAGVTQEVKADRAISALTQLTAPKARVLRDGEQRQIPAADVVAGDLLVLAEGDIVPADARVAEAAALLVDESALTGESVPVDKSPGEAPGREPRPGVGGHGGGPRPGPGGCDGDRDGQRDGPHRRADAAQGRADPPAAADGRSGPRPGGGGGGACARSCSRSAWPAASPPS